MTETETIQGVFARYVAHNERELCPMLNEDEIRYEMVAGLDRALHGDVTARDATPEEVWSELLTEVTLLVNSEPPSRERKLDEAIDAVTAWLAKFRSAN